ncbi:MULTISPECIES: DUF6414 family protein [unclassified Rhodococcus (in: high G+C Gram-positive bacteria)]|uniref:DUF6414 family protein n=1 Tax=unclassified Rhodococcus (in: high G+C Gram-positive bacteria) TaxID=192944 RepID=UPI00117AF14B|nr:MULTISPECIES: hypothetical protein [unclassified Rhodococcus (in: high G+C Gram-positive bacteria)]
MTPSTIPESGEPFLRDFFYVDADRVRSLLAQLYEGVPEQVKQSEESHKKWMVGLRGLGTVLRESDSSAAAEETRALSDLHFAMFEEAAEATGFLTDVTDIASDPKRWKRSKLHRVLHEGDLVRFSAPTRIIDPRHITSTLQRQDAAFGGTNPKPGGVEFSQVNKFVEALYGPGVVVRSFPAGLEEPECNFVGTLLDDPRYIEQERTSLFVRHGVDAQQWTVVGQIARLPVQGPSSQFALGSFQDMFSQGTQSLGRAKLEEFLSQVVGMIERTGLSEAPQHPGIVITPLAVYREIQVPTHRTSLGDAD